MLGAPLMLKDHLNQLDHIDAFKFEMSKTNIVDAK